MAIFCCVCAGLKVSDRRNVSVFSRVFIRAGEGGKFFFSRYKYGCSILRYCYKGVVIRAKVVSFGVFFNAAGSGVSIISNCLRNVVSVKFGGRG